jgi:methionyl-tRNA formyltransferase
MSTKVVFLGTPEFACPTLDALLADPLRYEVVGVITQPDKPAGRNLEVQSSRIHMLAKSYINPKAPKAKKLTILTPEKINDPLVLQKIAELNAEVAIVVAFGQILSPQFLKLFKYGALNVHASILPRWRGAAPIQWSILSEDPVTGVSLQKIVPALDAGDVLAVSQVDLDESWDAPKLYSELSKRGADLVRKTLPDYIAGKVKGTPQDPTQVTLAPKIKKEQGLIDWSLRASQICAKLRAFSPWPGVWTTRGGKILKILRAKPIEFRGSSPPGYLVSQDKYGFAVQCGGSTALLITVVQPESRSRQPASEYLRGYPFVKGEYLGA